MTDIFVAIASTETALLDIAKQVSGLAGGLENVAPINKTNAPNRSVQYLLDVSERLNELAVKCRKLLAHGNQEQDKRIHELMLEAVQHDKDLREQYEIKDKFRFIRDRLNLLLANIEEVLAATEKLTPEKASGASDDEMLVYVYLFNAQGIMLQTWQKMVNPSVFYEHSVNRPIYLDQAHVEAFIGRKANKVQHGYLTMIIKKSDLHKAEGALPLKDVYDNPIAKAKEGSLQFKNLLAFTHNSIDYVIDSEGQLIKKV
jgi:hypothetical protein